MEKTIDPKDYRRALEFEQGRRSAPPRNHAADTQAEFNSAGYFFDEETGEYRPIIYRHDNRILVSTKSWQERRTEELQGMKTRQKEWNAFGFWMFIVFALCFMGLAGGGFSKPESGLLLIIGGFLAVVFIFIALPAMVLEESKYRSGNQEMVGAKVFDPRPPLPRGREQVEKEKAYGRTEFATAAEIHDLAAGRGARSNADDVTFDD